MQLARPILTVGAAMALMVGVGGAAFAQSAAERAVEAAKKFAGITLDVTWEAGLQANDPKQFSGPMWEKLTGIKINVVEIPIEELFTRTVQEHRAGSGAFDVLNVVPSWMPDLARIGALEPLDPYVDQFGYRDELADIADVFRENQMTYQGTIFGFPDDGDVLIEYYRKDLFGDPTHQANFKARFGYDLAPPQTWEQFLQISQYFTEATEGPGVGPNFYGSAQIRTPGLVHYFFEERFRNNGGLFFDADSMDATINTDAGVKAIANMIKEFDFAPPGAAEFGPIEVLSKWLEGDLAMITWWPPPGRWSAGLARNVPGLSFVPDSQVVGKVGYAIQPGNAPELAAGFDLSVSSDSDNKEAAYLFIQWLNSKEISLQRVMLPFALRDPFRFSHFQSTQYRDLWPSAGDYLDTLREAAKTGLLDLSIQNTFAYEESLTRAITASFGGDDPQAALNRAASEWNAITKDVGVDSQRASYLDWTSKPQAYPN